MCLWITCPSVGMEICQKPHTNGACAAGSIKCSLAWMRNWKCVCVFALCMDTDLGKSRFIRNHLVKILLSNLKLILKNTFFRMDFRLTPDGNVALEMYFCSPVPFYASFSSPFPPPSPLLLLLGGSGATVESSLHAGHAPHRYKSVSLTHTHTHLHFFHFFFFTSSYVYRHQSSHLYFSPLF